MKIRRYLNEAKKIKIVTVYGPPEAARVHPLMVGQEYDVIKFEKGGAVIWGKSLVGKRKILIPSRYYEMLA